MPATPIKMLLGHFCCDFEHDGGDFDMLPTSPEHADAGTPHMDMGNLDPTANFNFPFAIGLSGGLHILSNCTKAALLAMPHYEARVHVMLDKLASALHARFFRERLVATCFTVGPGRAYKHLFATFSCTLVKWRWGSFVQVCVELLLREEALRSCWRKDAIAFKSTEPSAASHQAFLQGAQEPDENVAVKLHSEHLSGPSLEKTSEAVQSHFFWAWLHMAQAINNALGHIEHWLESCQCHGRDDLPGHIKQTTTCPLKGRRQAEIAAGDLDQLLCDLFAEHSALIALQHAQQLNDEERVFLMEDFEAARAHIIYYIRTQFAPMRQLPRLLHALGHYDVDKARAAAVRCLNLWHQMSPEAQQAAHPATRAFCQASSPLAQMVVDFVNGADLQDLPLLAFHLGRLWWAPTAERSVERKHALTHKTLARSTSAGPSVISLEQRLPVDIKQRLRSDASFLLLLGEACRCCYNPASMFDSLAFSITHTCKRLRAKGLASLHQSRLPGSTTSGQGGYLQVGCCIPVC